LYEPGIVLVPPSFPPNHESFTARGKSTVACFGTSEVHELAERNGRNPKTGEAMTILPSKLPAFKTG
jgi:DNA-binding protein HU-beta